MHGGHDISISLDILGVDDFILNAENALRGARKAEAEAICHRSCQR